ncbi:MAG: FMN-binding negative transcriptional regulator [Rubrivivax sp.]
MYLPAHFEITDPAALHELVRRHPLAMWATVVDGLPVVNHVPFRLDAARGEHGTLVGHVARANPVWRTPAPSVLAFRAADGYVSPNGYAAKREHGKVVPTWNYAVVHAHGTPRIVDDRDALLAIVTALTTEHEAAQAHPWAVNDAPADYVEQMLRAIVGIEIPVQRWVGKFKLSQNRSGADVVGVVAGLRQQQPAGGEALAGWMQEYAPR